TSQPQPQSWGTRPPGVAAIDSGLSSKAVSHGKAVQKSNSSQESLSIRHSHTHLRALSLAPAEVALQHSCVAWNSLAWYNYHKNSGGNCTFVSPWCLLLLQILLYASVKQSGTSEKQNADPDQHRADKSVPEQSVQPRSDADPCATEF